MSEEERAEIAAHVELHGSIPQRFSKPVLTELERVRAELDLWRDAEKRESTEQARIALKAMAERDAALADVARLRGALDAMLRAWDRFAPGPLVTLSGKPTSYDKAKEALAATDPAGRKT